MKEHQSLAAGALQERQHLVGLPSLLGVILEVASMMKMVLMLLSSCQTLCEISLVEVVQGAGLDLQRLVLPQFLGEVGVSHEVTAPVWGDET